MLCLSCEWFCVKDEEGRLRGPWKPCAGAGKQPDLQMRFVPAVPVTADGINAYVAFSKLKEEGEPWPSGWALQLLNIQPKCAL